MSVYVSVYVCVSVCVYVYIAVCVILFDSSFFFLVHLLIDLSCSCTDHAQISWRNRVEPDLDPLKKLMVIAFKIETKARKK